MAINKFILISGCPRSGTSLAMDIQRAVHGDEAIMGTKFPQWTGDQKDDITGPMSGINEYFKSKTEEKPKKKDDFRDLNPNGFWEMPFTCGGIRYSMKLKGYFDELKKGSRFVKVVSQGLPLSDPIYIDKIIYMIRDPKSTAKSQERLSRKDMMNGIEINGKEKPFNSPEMFINVSISAARFFSVYPEIPVCFVNYRDLTTDTEKQLKRMQDFVGYGDYSKGSDIIDSSLVRSNTERKSESRIWDDAWHIYDEFNRASELVKIGESPKRIFEELVKWSMRSDRALVMRNRKWFCARADTQVNAIICKRCMSNDKFRSTLKSNPRNEKTKFPDWKNEPCMWECGMKHKSCTEPIKIEESISKNFWLNPCCVCDNYKDGCNAVDGLSVDMCKDVAECDKFKHKDRIC